MSGRWEERDLVAALAANDQLRLVDDEAQPGPAPASARNGCPGRRTKQDDPWTETEKTFARDWLQPRLEAGEYLWYMAQVTLYQVGQTYTFDFVALRPDGGADHFEVKGSQKLLSQSRSSVKVRWAAAFLRPAGQGPHRVFWAKKQEDGWQVREVKPRRRRHPIVRGG